MKYIFNNNYIKSNETIFIIGIILTILIILLLLFIGIKVIKKK